MLPSYVLILYLYQQTTKQKCRIFNRHMSRLVNQQKITQIMRLTKKNTQIMKLINYYDMINH